MKHMDDLSFKCVSVLLNQYYLRYKRIPPIEEFLYLQKIIRKHIMSRRQFTEEQINILRQNPYVFSVTSARLTLLEDHGFDIGILGERHIWSISQHIREGYKKYGEFNKGYEPPPSRSTPLANPNQPFSEKDELKQLRHRTKS